MWDNLFDSTLQGNFCETGKRQEALTPAEADCTTNFTPARMQAFTAGRACAKNALRQLQCAAPQITALHNGLPCWPNGFAGSISHAAQLAGAVVGKTDVWRSIGLDVETCGCVKQTEWDMLFVASEQRFLRGLPASEANNRATSYFSAKEAAYKLQFYITHTPLWFTDFCVTETADGLTVKLLKRQKQVPAFLLVHSIVKNGHTINLCLLPCN